MINRILGEVRENIRNEKVLFFSSIVSMTIIFLILDFFCVSAVNFIKFNDYVKKNMQVKIYLEKGITKDGIIELEKKLLKYDEVLKTKYVSKEIALAELSKSLDIEFDYSDNPLPDTILIMIAENTDVDIFSEKIKNEPGIESVDAKSEFLKKISNFNIAVKNMFIYIAAIVLIPIFILIFNLVYSTIMVRKKDIEIMSLVGATRFYIKTPFIIESFVNVILATFFSTLIFIPMYNLLREGLRIVVPFISVVSWQEILPVIVTLVFSVGLFVSFFSTIVTIKIYLKLYGE